MWAVLAIAAVSGLMQYYNSEKARGANAARLKELENQFNKIVPPEYDLKIYDNPKFAENIPPAALNTEAITPEFYQSVGQYIPQVAEFVQEAKPELVQATEAANIGRKSQMEALEKYRQIAQGGFDPELEQKLSEASRRANADAQSRTASILQDANRRGQFGSGISMALQQNAAMDAFDRQNQSSLMAAAESYRNQLGALDKSANLGGDIRQSEMAEQAKNVGILNDFNQRASKNYQDYLSMRADQINKASILNLDRNQKIADANVALKNKSKEEARDLSNKQQMLNTESQWKNRQNTLELEDRKNQLKSKMYSDLLNRYGIQTNLGKMGMDQTTQTAQDRNAATQGVSDAAMAAYLYGQKQPQEKPKEQPMPDYGTPYGYQDDEYSGRYVKPNEEDRAAYPF